MRKGVGAGVRTSGARAARTFGRIVLVAFLALATLAATPSPASPPPPAAQPTEAEQALQAFTRNRESVAAAYAGRYGIAPDLARAIMRAASRERIPLRLAFRLVRVESGFRPDAVSPVGAVGLAQVMPATGWWWCGLRRSELFEPAANLGCGFSYLRYLLDRHRGDVRLALLAYNRGPGTVDAIRRVGGDPANGYARAVLG